MERYSGEETTKLLPNDLKVIMFLGVFFIAFFFVVIVPWLIGVWRIINFIKEFFI